MSVEVLGIQFNETLCGVGVEAGVPVKFKPVTEAPLTVAEAVEGVNVYPDRLGATTYEPLERLEKLKFPAGSVVACPEVVPDKVNVAAVPVTLPEIMYVPAGTKTRSTQ